MTRQAVSQRIAEIDRETTRLVRLIVTAGSSRTRPDEDVLKKLSALSVERVRLTRPDYAESA